MSSRRRYARPSLPSPPMQALNDWPAPWPPPTAVLSAAPAARGCVVSRSSSRGRSSLRCSVAMVMGVLWCCGGPGRSDCDSARRPSSAFHSALSPASCSLLLAVCLLVPYRGPVRRDRHRQRLGVLPRDGLPRRWCLGGHGRGRAAARVRNRHDGPLLGLAADVRLALRRRCSARGCVWWYVKRMEIPACRGDSLRRSTAGR